MREDFLHYVWKNQRLEIKDLVTCDGQKVEISDFGKYNLSDGPDFKNASVVINGTQWFGQVEMHVKSSDWYLHAHDSDPAYDNVILHVVMKDDKPVRNQEGALVPTLELSKYLQKGLHKSYLRLMSQESWIPCQSQFSKVDEATKADFLQELLVKRLRRKVEELAQIQSLNKNDWEESFFQCLCKQLGFKKNGETFQDLAQRTPLKILLRHRDKLKELEAILFGQAGMLNAEFQDDYPRELQKTYSAIKNKYQLSELSLVAWKFLRMRPSNFPTIRIAQLARLIHQSNHLFSKVLSIKNQKEVYNMFDITISNYWRDHYVFDKLSKPAVKSLGKSSIDIISINTIVPFLYLYGMEKGELKIKELAVDLLRSIAPEKNSIISNWNALGVKAKNASDTQALLELKNNFCLKKKCLDCKIGNAVLQNQGLKKIVLKD